MLSVCSRPRLASLLLFAAAVMSLSFCSAALGQGGPRGPGGGVGAPTPHPSSAPAPARRPQFGPIGPVRLVKQIEVTGQRNVREARIRSYLKSRVDRPFDPELLQQDVRALTGSGLFQDVRTYTREVPGGIAVTIEVFERPTIAYIKVVGNTAFSDKHLGEKSGLKVGDALNIYAVDGAAGKVEDFYHSKGYRQTLVSVIEGNRPGDAGVVFSVDESPKERIWSVDFVGNKIVSDGRLKTQIQSKPAMLKYGLFHGTVDPKQIDEDVQRLTAYYRQLGYFHARVGREIHVSDNGAWTSITYVIDEGPRYNVRRISFLGNEKFSDEELAAQLHMQQGELFHMASMNGDLRSLRDLYGGEGFIFANIQAEPRFFEEPGELDLVYNISEGDQFRVGEIRVHIEGANPHTRRSVVLNRLSFAPGDIIDSREIRDSERRLKFSQLFRNEPQRGVAPRIVVRPPELDEPSQIANTPLGPRRSAAGGTYRGQTPEFDAHEVRRAIVDVYVDQPDELHRLPPVD